MPNIDFKAVLESMYLDMMEETYKHLELNKFQWTDDIPLDKAEKKDLLIEMIEYFEEKEDFEKCEALQKMKGV